ncbi:MAG: RNA polymerase factor sigma-54 [Rhodocyclaceae bacterium]|jgi:RNA polymerase sigma-54 factor|nr:RNA polymerase factor sigma-54 [Rhodocyclaceae bacterium]
MKQTLQLKLSQHLALTPQLQQSIRLLQLSTLELNQEIENFLQENPLLEREDEPAPETPLYSASGDALQAPTESLDGAMPEPNFGDASPADWEGGGTSAARDDRNDDEPSYAEIQAAATSLRDHLGTQLAMMPLSERDRSLVRLLIEALDDDGYLAQSLDELVDMLPPELEVDLDDLQIALKHLQNFDPPGIGARNAAECLALQLANLAESKTRDLALKIVRNHLDQLAARDYVRLRKAVACSEDELRDAQALIRSLNPRPGAQYSPAETRYVVPDVVVRKVRGQWTASLNAEAMPRLRINRLYADILQGSRGSGLASQLQEAKWLIKNVQQRFETIQRVSQAIVDRQRQFFEHGEVAMRPLTLREIADQLGLHESTISRVTTQKYMATPRGVYELKYFFGSHVATEAGGAASSTAIRALIKQLVGAEDGKKPLSDAQLAEILGQQGIVVARRTVAKYREAMNIPPVNLRKSI